MANKAGVTYGLDKELEAKMQSKYSLQLEAEVRGEVQACTLLPVRLFACIEQLEI